MNYTRVTDCDFNNGEGVRVTLWISGCSHHCSGCHNEWMQKYSIGKPVLEAWGEIEKYSDKDYISGLTISGGDPLDQTNFTELVRLIKMYRSRFPSKTIWIYTGFYYGELNPAQREVVDLCDVVVDGPYIESLRDLTLPFRGSSNQHLICK